MHGLRHGMIAARIQRWRETHATGKARRLVREDVAEQVRGGDEDEIPCADAGTTN
jgi:hypothetical protein